MFFPVGQSIKIWQGYKEPLLPGLGIEERILGAGTFIACSQTSVLPVLRPLDLDLNLDLHHWLPWFTGLWLWTRASPLASWPSSLQRTDSETSQLP